LNITRCALGLSVILSGCALIRGYSVIEYVETLRGKPLKPYIQCQCIDSLHVVSIKEQNQQAPKFRLVGSDTVSVVDGFRVMYAFSSRDYPFAKLMAEQSSPEKYDSDKEKCKSNLDKAAKQSRLAQATDTTTNGFEVFGTENDSIGKGNVLGQYLIFSNRDNAIITVYFFNQGEQNHAFKNAHEFKTLRAAFINSYTSCIAKRNQETPLSL